MSDTKIQRARRAAGLCARCAEPSENFRCEGCRLQETIKKRARKDARTGLTHEQRVARSMANLTQARGA